MIAAAAIERAFTECFLASHRTILVGGGAEPLYTPPGVGHGRIVYREDFAASALHEVAHWCVAGPARRALVDFGYWYAPDGRSAAQQEEFERVEVAPQALEWVFADAVGLPFRPSADNVLAGVGPSPTFVAALGERRSRLLADGLPARAARFHGALTRLRAASSPDGVPPG